MHEKTLNQSEGGLEQVLSYFRSKGKVARIPKISEKEINSENANQGKIEGENFLLRLATGDFTFTIHFSKTERKRNINSSFMNYINVDA